MSKDALVKLGLTEEQANKVLELHAEAVKGFVPKEKLLETEQEKNRLTATLGERDKQLEGLKGAAGANDELKKKLEEAIAKNKADSEQATADLAAFKKVSMVGLQILKSGAKNPKTVVALLDLSKISVDGENVIGLQEQLAALKVSDAYLFEPLITGYEPFGGDKQMQNGFKDNPFKKETFNLTKQGQILRDNPELAAKLKAAAGIK